MNVKTYGKAVQRCEKKERITQVAWHFLLHYMGNLTAKQNWGTKRYCFAPWCFTRLGVVFHMTMQDGSRNFRDVPDCKVSNLTMPQYISLYWLTRSLDFWYCINSRCHFVGGYKAHFHYYHLIFLSSFYLHHFLLPKLKN